MAHQKTNAHHFAKDLSKPVAKHLGAASKCQVDEEKGAGLAPEARVMDMRPGLYQAGVTRIGGTRDSTRENFCRAIAGIAANVIALSRCAVLFAENCFP